MITGIRFVLLFWLLFLLCLGALAFSLKQNKFRLLNGILGNLSILFLGLAIVFSIMYSQIEWLERLLLLIAVVILIPLFVLYLSLGILLLWNAVIVWRKESHSLGNLLTLFLGLAIVLSPLFSRLLRSFLPAALVDALFGISGILVFYLAFWLLNFITSFLITRLFQPKLDKKYIIVLGSGLLGGERVSPLLASRIMKAKDFADRQFKKTGLRPLIIFSGGRGPDEKLPEGLAMKNYAQQHGMQGYELIAEEKSRNTYENMLFSKKILVEKKIPLAAGIFSTSDYHTFRAAGYARYVGLKIDGIGAKTSKFFIPNAFLREYVAILMNHKVFHLIFLGLLILLDILFFIVQINYH
jgi:uncharacterized SAM-binding protein YcdF (DUF218 family)